MYIYIDISISTVMFVVRASKTDSYVGAGYGNCQFKGPSIFFNFGHTYMDVEQLLGATMSSMWV